MPQPPVRWQPLAVPKLQLRAPMRPPVPKPPQQPSQTKPEQPRPFPPTQQQPGPGQP